ncbi:hypothetical protein [Pseudonocardia lacus]|uniref:hypothetical protein n=1 Tax=Pseudonocardia lacus TaxID=2835865 RepID=UPI001BDC39AF|nr:hypothetical protein [Pseudonocardia lacus]
MQPPPTGVPTALGTVSELALLLAELHPTAAARLACDHVADTSGRCRLCRSVWPCTLHVIGRDAVAHARTTRLPGR